MSRMLIEWPDDFELTTSEEMAVFGLGNLCRVLPPSALLIEDGLEAAVERMVDVHLRQQGQDPAVVRFSMPRFVEAGRSYCRELLAAAEGKQP
jgi:hypothetical protein